jgi:hypothetical protein
VPVVAPVTTPAALMIALLPGVLHVPPATLLLSVMVESTQTDEGPVIVPATGSGLTVITAVADADPQLLVRV